MALLKQPPPENLNPEKKTPLKAQKRKVKGPESESSSNGEGSSRADSLEISREELEDYAHRGDFRADWSDNADDFDSSDWTVISTEEHGFIGTRADNRGLETEDIDPDDVIPQNAGWQSVLDPVPDGSGKGKRHRQ